MPYPESFIGPMREELTRLGVEELRTPDAVDAFVDSKGQTVMIVVNSMCGCAAGKARPGIALALAHGSLIPAHSGLRLDQRPPGTRAKCQSQSIETVSPGPLL